MDKPNAHIALTAVLDCRVAVSCLIVWFVFIEISHCTHSFAQPALYKTGRLTVSSISCKLTHQSFVTLCFLVAKFRFA